MQQPCTAARSHKKIRGTPGTCMQEAMPERQEGWSTSTSRPGGCSQHKRLPVARSAYLLHEHGPLLIRGHIGGRNNAYAEVLQRDEAEALACALHAAMLPRNSSAQVLAAALVKEGMHLQLTADAPALPIFTTLSASGVIRRTRDLWLRLSIVTASPSGRISSSVKRSCRGARGSWCRSARRSEKRDRNLNPGGGAALSLFAHSMKSRKLIRVTPAPIMFSANISQSVRATRAPSGAREPLQMAGATRQRFAAHWLS